MFNHKFQLKRLLLLFTALVMMATLVISCQSTDEGTKEKMTIKFSDRQWESQWINNAIAIFVIEEGYGYPTETIEMSSPVMQVSLPKGEIHVDTELWKQNIPEWFNEETANGNIVELGMTYEGGPQFWMVPEWVHEEYNINTVDDLKDNWELFKDPEEPTKGVFVNSIIGWQCTEINVLKMEAYGLDEYYNIVSTGSSGALDAALSGPQKKHDPVFGYYWAPTAIMGMYDWYILEEPPYDEEVWTQLLAAIDDESLRPVSNACAYETVPITKAVWSGLLEEAPEIAAMLLKMVVGLEPLNRTAAWSVDNEVQDYEKAAVWYLRNYESRWKTWVTTDAYDKIKEALDNYEATP